MTLYGETRGRTTMRKFPRANTREHTAPKLLNSPSKIHIHTTNSPSGQKGNKMNDRTAATAARFGISEQCAALQRDLLTLPGAVKVEFDLDGFYDHMEQVILLVKFDVAYRNYFRDLRALRQGVIDTAARHGLTRTPDTIENYGEHLYFVFHHDSTWEHPVTEQPD